MKLKQLITDYPEIFKYSDTRRVPFIKREFECGDGWYLLIDGLCKQLTAITKETGIKIYCTQCKEKFGYLSFYTEEDYTSVKNNGNEWWSIINSVCAYASVKSRLTCEICGDFGTIDGDSSWLKCRCNKCE